MGHASGALRTAGANAASALPIRPNPPRGDEPRNATKGAHHVVPVLSTLPSPRPPRRAAVLAVVVANALWVIDSVLLLALGWVEPKALGYAFVAAQALVVALFAEAQVLGLRRARMTA